jgi:large subunit ribosomal protein L7/L12
MAEENKQQPSQKEEKKEEKVKIPKKFEGLIEEIEKMSVSDLAELVKILEKKFGVSSAPQMVVSQAPVTSGASSPGTGAVSEEKSIFNVVLSSIGSKKIEVIKVVRDATGKGLKESKDLVDAAEKEPQTVKENVKKEEAEELKKKFEVAGAGVELK